MLVKEFLLVLRDRHALAALFIMPAVFILIMSIALQDTLGNHRPLIHYTVRDRDNTPQSQQLQHFLESSKVLIRENIPVPDARHLQEALGHGLQLVITIPHGFALQLQTDQKKPRIRLDVAPDTRQEILTIFQAKLTADILRLRLGQIQKSLAPYVPDAAQHIREISSYSTGLTDIHYNGSKNNTIPSATQQSVPSWIVFGMFFVIIPMSTVFINERKQNTLLRMSTMNISIPVLFTGKIVPYLFINQLQVGLMIGVGMFVVPLLGGDALTIGHSAGGLALVSLALSFAAIGTSMLIAVLAKTVEQATTVGGIINILFGAIGGVMVPKFYMHHSIQQLADISPMSWGLEGFLDIFLRNQGITAVLRESLALGLFGAVLLIVAGYILHRQLHRGL